MFKSALFIAVKCCQCSTMQVKQQKKSSNKWNCVVCNQKQSVTKVYAQGYQAKEIRKVVQSFNMSRKFDDDQLPSLGHFVEHLEGDLQAEEKKANPRTDWTQFIEEDSNEEPAYLKSKFNEKEMGAEPRVVTEFPEDLMFKKPKLKGEFDSSFQSEKNQSYKPNFSKRAVSTKEKIEMKSSASNPEYILDDKELTRYVRRHTEQQHELTKRMNRGSGRQIEPSKRMKMMKASDSKWSKYMADEEEEGDDGAEGVNPAFSDDIRLMYGYKLDTETNDQVVEEDIHPDFI